MKWDMEREEKKEVENAKKEARRYFLAKGHNMEGCVSQCLSK